MTTTLSRRYRVSDSEMIAVANEIIHDFKNYSQQFYAFDPILFNDEFTTKLLRAYDNCILIDSDSDMVEELKEKSQTLAETRAIVVEELRTARYFVKKAFGKTPDKYREFGFQRLNSNRKNSKQLYYLLQDFLMIAQKESSSLIEHGFPRTLFQKLTELELDLGARKSRQRGIKRLRKEHTEQRISTFNELWDLLFQICTAAKILKRQSPEMVPLFVLPAPESQRHHESIPV